MKGRVWTKEMDEYLESIVQGKFEKEIRLMMIEKFGGDFAKESIHARKSKLGLKSGIYNLHGNIGSFKKGLVPWNKGKKMDKKTYEKLRPTMFKAGHKNKNERPALTERVAKDGYVEIKDPVKNKFVFKHRYLYEIYHNEKLTSNDVIIFLDADITNFDKDNLVKVDRAILARLNHQFKFKKGESAYNKNQILLAKLKLAIGEKEKCVK